MDPPKFGRFIGRMNNRMQTAPMRISMIGRKAHDLSIVSANPLALGDSFVDSCLPVCVADQSGSSPLEQKSRSLLPRLSKWRFARALAAHVCACVPISRMNGGAIRRAELSHNSELRARKFSRAINCLSSDAAGRWEDAIRKLLDARDHVNSRARLHRACIARRRAVIAIGLARASRRFRSAGHDKPRD